VEEGLRRQILFGWIDHAPDCKLDVAPPQFGYQDAGRLDNEMEDHAGILRDQSIDDR
jgi:hypothetical protein